MNIPDYPVTELFGCQPGYPLNTNLCPPGQGYHNGIDYGCPTGTAIIVNGVTIGLSGATGEVTGPHCHVGKWVNGVALDPGVGNGFIFSSAVVTEVNEDSVNGKYIRVQGDSASWVYLHMSDNSLVKVNQVLEADMVQTEEDNRGVFLAVVGRNPYPQEVGRYIGQEWPDALKSCLDNADRQNINKMITAYYKNGSAIPSPGDPSVMVNGQIYVKS